MPSTEILIAEASDFSILADVEYRVVPACGDGWNEPHEPAYAEVTAVSLFKRREKRTFTPTTDAQGRPSYRVHVERLPDEPIPGDAPDWVWDIAQAHDDFDLDDDGRDWDAMPGGHDWLRDRELEGRL